MARNLKKFVNPKFVRTVPLDLMWRLLARHQAELPAFELSVLGGEAAAARKAIHDYFAGPEDQYPRGLVADLHRIAEVGTRQGLDILLERARRAGVSLVLEPGRDSSREDPKHVALTAFIEQPTIFNEAADILASRLVSSLSEFAGRELEVQPRLDDETRAACEKAISTILRADLHGDYCQIGWHDDAGETCLIVTHGDKITTTAVLRGEKEDVICYRPMAQSRLRYSAAEGRLKVGGGGRRRRRVIAEAFAKAILGRPGFFAGGRAQDLYTLTGLERRWPHVRLTFAHDLLIRRVQVTEVRLDRLAPSLVAGVGSVDWSLVVTDRSDCALARLRELKPDLSFRNGAWRLGHIVLSVHIQADRKEPIPVAVRIQPKGEASFRRVRFEGQIMELLERNGFCHERDTDGPALAAE